jgi:hypothetical protein
LPDVENKRSRSGVVLALAGVLAVAAAVVFYMSGKPAANTGTDRSADPVTHQKSPEANTPTTSGFTAGATVTPVASTEPNLAPPASASEQPATKPSAAPASTRGTHRPTAPHTAPTTTAVATASSASGTTTVHPADTSHPVKKPRSLDNENPFQHD